MTQKEKVILFFGLLRPYKGAKKLIQAFQKVAEHHPDCELWIVGDCYVTQTHPHGSRIQFRNPFVPNEALELYFKTADLYESATKVVFSPYAFEVPVVEDFLNWSKKEKQDPNNDPEILAHAGARP